MTAHHPFHSHHHLLNEVWLRYLLPILLALLLFLWLATPVHGQVLLDESQLHGNLPSWVDAAYEKAPPAQPPIVVVRPPVYPPTYPPHRVWVPAVTQTVTERVWIDDRYEYRMIECDEGYRRVWKRVLVLVEPGHFETRCREVVIVPGHWETIIREYPYGR